VEILMVSKKRTKSIIIRCTEEEHAALLANKQRHELARWLRELGLSVDRSKVIKHELPPDVVRILAGVSGNLNQAVKNINSLVKAGLLNKVDSLELMVQLVHTEKALMLVRAYLDKNRDLDAG
jgi:hypothetical protein